MGLRSAVASSALVAALCVVAWAKDPPKSRWDERLEEAKAAAAKDPLRAAGVYGELIASAQKGKELVRETLAADALDELVGAAPEGGAPGGTSADVGMRSLLAAVMKSLDPKRNGACVSAHAIAVRLIHEAAARGDGAYVEEAAAVLTAHAATPKSGKAAPVLAQWGQGMRAARAGEGEAADAALLSAFEAFSANGWTELALDAATELAVLRLAAKDEAKATAAVALAAGLLAPYTDPVVVQGWEKTVRARLKDAPEGVLAPFVRATETPRRASAGAAGGRGGAGGSADGVNVSPVGRAWPKLPSDRPFVTATRGKDGLTMRVAFDEDVKALQPMAHGQKHWDHGGVTVALAGTSVALSMVDMEGLLGQPGERPRPSAVRAFYLLAEGETWGVSRTGVVTVTD